MHIRHSHLVIHFECGIAYSCIYLVDEWMSSVIFASHMYDMNTVWDNQEGAEGGFKLDQEICHGEPPVITSPGLISDHEVLS